MQREGKTSARLRLVMRRRKERGPMLARDVRMSWSAAQYVKFEGERTRPVRDLVRRIPLAHPMSAVDLGCGPGNSTEVLRERYPEARIVGVDSSPDMIAAARKRLPDIAFEVTDVREWRPKEPLDVILANAVLQWIPGHETLLPALIAKLKPGGALAAQMPDNLEEPSHRLMREIAADGPWATKLKDAAAARAERHDAGWYFRLLSLQAPHVDVWRTTYFHPLAGAHAVVEWLKGSGLRPFLDPLEESEKEAFLARYEAVVAKAYPAEPDGIVLLPFPRLFCVATR
jgi:trans-aconitate 2-methyltransferase